MSSIGGATRVDGKAAAQPVGLPMAVKSAKLVQKQYLPTALLKAQLPAGFGDLTKVPTLAPGNGETLEERIEQYAAAIRSTACVFATYNHSQDTLKAYDMYTLWVDAWLKLSGFGEYFVVGRFDLLSVG